MEVVVRVCVLAFPSLWVSCNAPFCIATIEGILVHTDFFSCALIDLSLAFGVLACASVWALQIVSTPRQLAFFPCPDLSLCLGSLDGVCPLLASILSMS